MWLLIRRLRPSNVRGETGHSFSDIIAHGHNFLCFGKARGTCCRSAQLSQAFSGDVHMNITKTFAQIHQAITYACFTQPSNDANNSTCPNGLLLPLISAHRVFNGYTLCLQKNPLSRFQGHSLSLTISNNKFRPEMRRGTYKPVFQPA